MKYLTHEGEMVIPQGFCDRSLHALEVDHPRGPISLNVMRVPTDGETLAHATEIHVTKLRRGLAQYALLHRRDVVVGGVAASDVAVRYAMDTGPVAQRMALALRSSQLWILTVAGTTEQTSDVDDIFEHALSTLVWRDEGSA